MSKTGFVRWISCLLGIVLLMLFVFVSLCVPAAQQPGEPEGAPATLARLRSSRDDVPRREPILRQANTEESSIRPIVRSTPLRTVFGLFLLVVSAFFVVFFINRNLSVYIEQKVSCISACLGGHSPPAIS